MAWTHQKLLELLLSWSDFLDIALRYSNLDLKSSTPKEVVKAALVLIVRGAYLTTQISEKDLLRPKDKNFTRERRTAKPAFEKERKLMKKD